MLFFFGLAFVFFLGLLFGGKPFPVVFFSAVFFFGLILGGIIFLGGFFGGILFLGLDFSQVSVFELLSVGFVIVGLAVAERCVGLFVVLCNCRSVLSSISGVGRGSG